MYAPASRLARLNCAGFTGAGRWIGAGTVRKARGLAVDGSLECRRIEKVLRWMHAIGALDQLCILGDTNPPGGEDSTLFTSISEV